jgi:hypothetical protein
MKECTPVGLNIRKACFIHSTGKQSAEAAWLTRNQRITGHRILEGRSSAIISSYNCALIRLRSVRTAISRSISEYVVFKRPVGQTLSYQALSARGQFSMLCNSIPLTGSSKPSRCLEDSTEPTALVPGAEIAQTRQKQNEPPKGPQSSFHTAPAHATGSQQVCKQ